MRRPSSLFVFALIALIAVTGPALADEGMWQPHQLPSLAKELKAEGLEIAPEDLSDLLGYPMNAIISLGGCTASFVSPNGLAVTNHHCAYRALQFNSTPDNNLLENGFLAKDHSEEIPAGPGTRIYVTVDVDEVTEEINGGLDELDGTERFEALDERRKAMLADCEKEDGYRCRVASFYGGLEVYRIKQMEIRDVRIVYAPKGSVGLYGGEVDNWEWPRHTGDFTFYRGYVGPDGKPADPADDNVPFRPKHHLKVNPEGVSTGDYVMVTGYPGRTNRYRLASEVEYQFEERYPRSIERSNDRLEIIERLTADHPEDKIRYAGTVAGIKNGFKNNQGMVDGYRGSGLVERKKALEDAMRAWVNADEERKAKFAAALDELEEVIVEGREVRKKEGAFLSAAGGSSLASMAGVIYRAAHERQKPDMERDSFYQDRNRPRMESFLKRLDRTFSTRVDRELWLYSLENYVESETVERVARFDEIMGIGETFDREAVGAKLDEMYAKTVMLDSEKRMALLDATPESIEAMDDPFLSMAVEFYEDSRRREAESEERSGQLNRLRPLYMQAMLAYLESQGKRLYADANSTLRVTFGQVGGYSPRDAVSYAPFTTPQGFLEKETGEEPFNAPDELLNAVKNKAYGKYTSEELGGDLPVNFLGDLDITGGNSGSPTLNSRAEFIGIVFDGNYESIISDWDFRPEITRSIHVDVRYMLFVMDHLDNADYLIEEMGLEATPEAAAPMADAAP